MYSWTFAGRIVVDIDWTIKQIKKEQKLSKKGLGDFCAQYDPSFESFSKSNCSGKCSSKKKEHKKIYKNSYKKKFYKKKKEKDEDNKNKKPKKNFKILLVIIVVRKATLLDFAKSVKKLMS